MGWPTMQVHISPSMRRITISASPGFLDPMRMKGAARYLSYRCLFWTMLLLVFLLPFLFITTALVTLEGVNKCSSLGTHHHHHHHHAFFPDFTPPPLSLLLSYVIPIPFNPSPYFASWDRPP